MQVIDYGIKVFGTKRMKQNDNDSMGSATLILIANLKYSLNGYDL